MNVPEDYVASILTKAIDERISTLDEKMANVESNLGERINTLETNLLDRIESNREDRKEQLKEIKEEISEFHNLCYTNMKCHDDRIHDLEKFKYMIIAYSSVLSIISGFVFNIIISHI